MQKIHVRHQYDDLVPRRDYSRNTSYRFVEVLNFKHFSRHITFDQGDKLGRNKHINSYVTVSVMLRLECGDTSEVK